MTHSAAFADCKPLVLNLVEGWTPRSPGATYSAPEREGGRRATIAISCHGGSLGIPEMTNMSVMQEKNGKLCYRDRACGNVKSWEVSIGLSADWWNHTTSLGDFVSSGIVNVAENNTTDSIFSVEVGIEFGQIERYCKSVSEEICM